jgi:hypothetical protein
MLARVFVFRDVCWETELEWEICFLMLDVFVLNDPRTKPNRVAIPPRLRDGLHKTVTCHPVFSAAWWVQKQETPRPT